MSQASRNATCPCGSGKKFKNCCANKALAKPNKELQVDQIRRTIETVRQYISAGEVFYAEMLCKEILLDFPDEPELNFWLGVIYTMQGKINDAIDAYNITVREKHDHFNALSNLGGLLANIGRHAEAELWLRRAIQINKKSAETFTNLGVALHNQGKVDEAIESYRRAIQIDPTFSGAHYNLGNALNSQSNYDAAIESYRRTISLNPHHAAAHNNLNDTLRDQGALNRANTLRDQGKLLECQSLYQQVIALEPENADAHLNLALAFQYQGELDAATASYRSALKIDPENGDARMAMALLLLRMGALNQGWDGYESRWTKNHLPVEKRPFTHPWWQGESLAGKSILLWGEQGIGDEILFSSMFNDIIADADRCVIECAPKLLPLFVRSFPLAQVIAKIDPPHPMTMAKFDYQCSSGSLAQWLRPSIDCFPTHTGVIIPDAERVAFWKARLAELGAGPKIGFAWRSSIMTGVRTLYCSTLNQWGPIFEVPGAHFVNLQYDDCAVELNDARKRFGVALHCFEEIDLYNDLEEAAALNSALDLVISAPTAVPLLSGALGVKTWMMNYGVAWETLGTNRFPWFPSVECCNRQWDQTWESTIQQIAAKLESL